MRWLRDFIHVWKTDLEALESEIAEYENTIYDQADIIVSQKERIAELQIQLQTAQAMAKQNGDGLVRAQARYTETSEELQSQKRENYEQRRSVPWAVVKQNKGGKWYWVVETGDPHKVVAIGTGKFTNKADADKDAAESGLQVTG